MNENDANLRRDALLYHSRWPHGKISIQPTKPVLTQRDLALAYTPGVAEPVREIAKNPDCADDYTNRSNLVAVITNGTAVLGLGDQGPLAAKPVMEGKAVLFKRFADIDSIDLEVDARDPNDFINAVKHLSPSFGGVNLEDIKAPECFVIESALRDAMSVPVFHDDQHGTAIIAGAALINACLLTDKNIKNLKIVVNGAGAAGIACLNLFLSLGAQASNILLCDRKGVVHSQRDDLNQWKSPFASNTDARSLADAVKDSDVFLGVSAPGVLTPDMLTTMAPKPCIFALANPDPEISYALAKRSRPDAVVATGRSDNPNQVNNVLCFPYIFRGALDARASSINEPMKLACAHALAALARQDVPDEVHDAVGGSRPRFGPDYIIPAIFDPRLIHEIPPAVADAAVQSGVARIPPLDKDQYKQRLAARQDPVVGVLQRAVNSVRANPKRIIFAEGEEESSIAAALSFHDMNLGQPVLVGRPEIVMQTAKNMGVEQRIQSLSIKSARTDAAQTAPMAELLHQRLRRRGMLLRDCQRLVNNNRNVFAASLMLAGEADGMVTGVTRNHADALRDVSLVLDPAPNRKLMGVSLVLTKGSLILVADTNVHLNPDAETLADVASETARAAKQLGLSPRVAFLSHSSFGYREDDRTQAIRDALVILDGRSPDFEFEGEMSPDVAFNPSSRTTYPFSRLSGPANVAVMPSLHAARISTRMLSVLGQGRTLGPVLLGLERPVQIVHKNCSASELTQMAVLTAFDIGA